MMTADIPVSPTRAAHQMLSTRLARVERLRIIFELADMCSAWLFVVLGAGAPMLVVLALLGLPDVALALTPMVVMAALVALTGRIVRTRALNMAQKRLRSAVDDWWAKPGPCLCGFHDKYADHELRCSEAPGFNSVQPCDFHPVTGFTPVAIGQRLRPPGDRYAPQG